MGLRTMGSESMNTNHTDGAHDVSAYSMSRFQRVVGTDGRLSGTWVVMLASDRHRASVRPHDVTVYDEGRHSGRILGPDSLLAWVAKDGTVDLPEHMIRESIRDDVLDAKEELLELLPRIVEAAGSTDQESSDGSS
ncbi:hypothetical protein O1W71_16355 [Microbacterium sp. H37-C3]|uniref:hypothetical protein n=1 Tax=Microbacterium sp. H37-C3 TaxID=3004354 RepID=UPI0022AFF1CA|nr:hypothetical protein [Microbacterium sp. H37-C3]MCZ4069243.1 hypothetical protein [Microbacterium sp. H37-C3]